MSKVASFQSGDRVYARWPGTTTYYPGKLVEITASGATVLFDDGTDFDELPLDYLKSEKVMKSRRSSRSRSRSRGRSRGRSKSPARSTKPKQSPSPRRPRQKAAASPARPKQVTSPSRQSARIQQQASEKRDEVDGKPLVKQSSVKSPETPAETKFQYEMGGPIGTFIAMLVFPAVVLGINLACGKKSCTIQEFPAIPRQLSAYVDRESVLLVVGWVVFQAVLTLVPVGTVVKGRTPHNKHLNYRCNGLFVMAASYATIGVLAYLGYPVTIVYKKFWKLAVVSTGFSFLFSLYLYLSATKINGKGTSGCASYDFFMGREMHPTVFGLDLKYFLLTRPGFMSISVINAVFVLEAYSKGTLSPALALVVALQTVYFVDSMVFEEGLLTMQEMVSESFGFIMTFMAIVWIPFVFSVVPRYLLEHPQTWHPGCLVAFTALFLAGYVIFRGANSQKDRYRSDPHNPMFANLKQIPSSVSGKKLLASGWWGICRRPNYLGDILITLAFTLPCGFQAALPYFYFVATVLILLDRQIRDEVSCREKHGNAWDRYCREVKYRLIPYVY